jgi:hypothetical protein
MTHDNPLSFGPGRAERVTLRLAPGLTVIALAELILALAGAALIAVCSHAHSRARAAGRGYDDPRGG